MKEGMFFINQAVKVQDGHDNFGAKNIREAHRYEQLFLELRFKIKARAINPEPSV